MFKGTYLYDMDKSWIYFSLALATDLLSMGFSFRCSTKDFPINWVMSQVYEKQLDLLSALLWVLKFLSIKYSCVLTGFVFPFLQQLPYYIDGDMKISQSNAVSQ